MARCSMRPDRDIVMALAGVFQSASVTQQIARTGRADDDARHALLHSLLQIDAPDVAAVYDGIEHLRLGFECLRSQLIPGPERDMEITRYAIGLMQIERRLHRDRERLDMLAHDINELIARRNGLSLADDTLEVQFEEIYRSNISTIGTQIIVKGEPVYLENPRHAAAIRAALLAGVRSAMLWRQCGGSRIQLIFRRNRLLGEVERALAHIGEPTG